MKFPKRTERFGAPLRLTQEDVDAICSKVRLGARLSPACMTRGFSHGAWTRWLRVAKATLRKLRTDPDMKVSDSQAMYLYFASSYRRALGELECEATLKYYELSQEDADSLSSFLGKRFRSWRDKDGEDRAAREAMQQLAAEIKAARAQREPTIPANDGNGPGRVGPDAVVG